MTMSHFARLLVLLTVTSAVSGCRALSEGDTPNPDVGTWPEYTLKIDDVFVLVRFHPPLKPDGLSAMPGPEEIHEVDMLWLKQGTRSIGLFTACFDWNTQTHLPGFELGMGLEAFSKGRAALSPLDRIEQDIQEATRGTSASIELERGKIGTGEWVVFRLYRKGSLAGESYCLPLTDTYFLTASATYGPYARATAAWLNERRTILRQMAESVQVLQ